MKRKKRNDVTPPGREAQVRALKNKPDIDNPWAVAWASYNRSDAGTPYMAAKCDACGQKVPYMDGMLAPHVQEDWAPTGAGGGYGMDDGEAAGRKGGQMDAKMCDGSYDAYDAATHGPVEQQFSGSWLLLNQESGEVKGVFGTRPEAEAQQRQLPKADAISTGDLAVVWVGYSWKDPSVQAWPGSTCRTCAQNVRIVDGVLAPHLRATDRKPEDDVLCDGSGQKPGETTYEQSGDCWRVIVKSTGRDLGTFKTKAEADAKLDRIAGDLGRRGDSAARVQRFDLAALAAPERTADGFLKVDGRVARIGVQEYRDGMGRTRRELRLPDEVRRSVPGFALAPMTNTHPPEPVTPKNAKKYVVGAVGEATMTADGWVTAPLAIHDDAAIRDAEQGRRQLSVGYSCRLETVDDPDPSLVSRYGHYDALQRDIVVNHVALVDVARAGADARIRLDAADAIAVVCDTETPVASKLSTAEPTKMPIKMKLDGLEVEVGDANAQAIIERAIANAAKAGDDKAATEKTRADGLQKSLSELQAKYDGLDSQVKADAKKTVKVDGVDMPVAELVEKFDGIVLAAVDKRANARAALLAEARRHLGANEKLDGKSELEIKKLVIGKLDKDAKLDGRDDAYVATRYEVEIEKANRVRPIDNVRTLTGPAPKTGGNGDPPPARSDASVSPRQKMIADLQAQNVKTQKRGA